MDNKLKYQPEDSYDEILERRLEVARERIRRRYALRRSDYVRIKIRMRDIKQLSYRLALIIAGCLLFVIIARLINDIYYFFTGVDYEVLKESTFRWFNNF